MKVDDTRDGAGAGRRTGRFCGSSRQALHRFHTEMASVPFVAELLLTTPKRAGNHFLFSQSSFGNGHTHSD
jgi:hypothetical protein